MRTTEADLQYSSFAGDDLPVELRDSVRRHCVHLAALVASFRAAGVAESVIEAGIRDLAESYVRELTAAIRALVQDTSHAPG